MFIFSVDGRKFLADCPYDEEIEDFLNDYVIYEMPSDLDVCGSWIGLAECAAKKLGTIPIDKVLFDETKSKAVSESSLGSLLFCD